MYIYVYKRPFFDGKRLGLTGGKDLDESKYLVW